MPYIKFKKKARDYAELPIGMVIENGEETIIELTRELTDNEKERLNAIFAQDGKDEHTLTTEELTAVEAYFTSLLTSEVFVDKSEFCGTMEELKAYNARRERGVS